MKKIELLSPAGNMDSLIAAIEAGCDAVYLGGTMFSARAFAGNFSNDELIETVNLCHLYGVKVYVTCNILIYEHEIDNFMKYIDFLHKISVDAIIIQDLGMLDLIHKTYPNLELHASTQMHIHNLDGVIMANKLGCKRIVIARETPIEEVQKIIKKTGIDIEIFAHGSLCVSYSGECLFSSLIGNRSGNRGSCVGSCRLPYKIVDENNNRLNDGDYPLSMKDLNTLENIATLIESGVTSLKIEGRMKSPEYVYVVTKLYRMAIDSYYNNGKVIIDNNLLNDLRKIFNREYTKGYLFNESIYDIINSNRPNHQGVYIGKIIDYKNGFVKLKLISDVSINDGLRIVLDDEDYGIILNEFYIDNKLVKVAHEGDLISFKVNKKIPINSKVLLTKDISLINDINQIIKSHPRKVLINVKIIAKVGNKLEIIINDNEHMVELFGDTVEKACNHPTSYEEIISKIKKTGDTIYEINDLNIELDDNVFLPFKKLNELRHQALLQLNELRKYHIEYKKEDYHLEVNDYIHQKLHSVLVTKDNGNLNYDIIYSEDLSDKAIIKLPKVMMNYNNLDINREYLISELGAFNRLNNIYCDYTFNVTNSYTVALLHSLGAKRVTLSLELTSKQIKNIIDGYYHRYQSHPNLEVIISGYREVMTLKTNLNDIYNHDRLYLVDRFNNKYLIRKVGNLSYIYEPKRFTNNDDYFSMGVNVLRDNKEV